MRVKIFVTKKEGGPATMAADIHPAFFGLQDTLAEVVAKATFHEWKRVEMVFEYPERTEGISADGAHDMGQAQEAK